MADFSRRSMMKTAALVPLAAKAGCIRRIPTNRSVKVPAAVDGDVAISLAQAPELSRAGGAIVVRPDRSPGGYLVANTGTGYLALRAECPHEGCEVAWVQEDRQVECPCHGSRFAGDGKLPAAVRPLNIPSGAPLPAYRPGVRVATVTVISLATVAAFIVDEGLGAPIFAALQSSFNTEFIAAGALAVLLALVADALLVGVQRIVTPWARAGGAR